MRKARQLPEKVAANILIAFHATQIRAAELAAAVLSGAGGAHDAWGCSQRCRASSPAGGDQQ